MGERSGLDRRQARGAGSRAESEPVADRTRTDRTQEMSAENLGSGHRSASGEHNEKQNNMASDDAPAEDSGCNGRNIHFDQLR